jgi:uncharacterized DUF497 family protein
MPQDDHCSWTTEKARLNLLKHGYDFAQLHPAFDGRFMITRRDLRFDYGEERFNSLVMFDRRVVNVTWTPRDGKRHLISVRPASREERAVYHEREDEARRRDE